MSPGKQAAPSEAAAAMAAGARLEAMRRRVRLPRVALWTVIAAGPLALALAVAVASTSTTVAAAPAAKPTTAVRTATSATDPSGYAHVFIGAWLRSDANDETSAQARLAHSMAPDVELPAPAADAQSAPQSVTAVHSAQRAGGAWSVTVAAQYGGGSVRYYAVPVAADHAGSSFTVTGAPGVVAGPARADKPKSSYGVSVPEGDLSSAVGQFLGAYLTGGRGGELLPRAGRATHRRLPRPVHGAHPPGGGGRGGGRGRRAGAGGRHEGAGPRLGGSPGPGR
ncbi:hypothetical protein [Streptomyces sp. LUP30]|uniref:hypothetical protein n=1 Tax=Streptomyces sp. LUP30 TaxID=1890285 RepID=UPI000A843DAF